MRRRFITSSLAIVLVAVSLLGLALAFVGDQLIRDEARQRLVREGENITRAIEDGIESGNAIDANRLERLRPRGHRVVAVDRTGGSVVAGPPIEGRELTATVTTKDSRVSISAPYDEVRGRVLRAWLLVAGLVGVSLAIAVGFAIVQARRLIEPLDDLAVNAARLGAGDFRPQSRRYDLPELDRVADALDASAARIADLIRREREFASNASHQLRTPLTALQIRLEEISLAPDAATVREEAAAALAQTDRLTEVIEQLLATARHTRAGTVRPVDVAAIAREQAREWEPAYRRVDRALQVDAVPELHALATPARFGQVLATLLDNALMHGAGAVCITTRAAAEHVVVQVSDEGEGVPDWLVPHMFERSVSGRSSTGLGLAVARALVEADGGRLELVHPRPPVFAVFLPTVPTV